MDKEIITFGDIEVERHKSYPYKSQYIDNILVFNKISHGRKNCKYFIGYICGSYKVKTLHIMLPKTSRWVKSHDGQNK